MTDSYLDLLQF